MCQSAHLTYSKAKSKCHLSELNSTVNTTVGVLCLLSAWKINIHTEQGAVQMLISQDCILLRAWEAGRLQVCVKLWQWCIYFCEFSVSGVS